MTTGVTQVPNWWEDPVGAVREGIERDRGLRGKDEFGNPQKGGLFENIVGGVFNADDGSDYRQSATENKFKATIEELKPGSFKPGMTESYYKSQVRNLTNQRNNKEELESPQGRVLLANLDNQTETLRQQGKQIENTNTIALKGLEQREKQAANALQLNLAQLKQSGKVQEAQLQQNLDFRKMDKGDKASDRALAMQSARSTHGATCP